MRRIISFILCFAMLIVLCACSDAETEDRSEGLSIVTTLFPAYDFAREIAGENNTVTLLVPPGSEAHSFEPTPKDIITIEKCDLLICNGGESEAWLDEILDGLDNEIRVISMLDCVNALTEEIKDGMQTKEEGGEEYDEHVWTSPLNAALISEEICKVLCEISPENAESFNDNRKAYCAQLYELDEEFRTVVEAARFDTLVFADRFPVRYFVEEYGLDYFAAFPGCADDAEPSAKTVAFLIDRVRENNIPAVLYIEFSNEKMADIICEDTGCRKLLFHSCHNVSAEDIKNGVSYLELMRSNLVSVKEALG